MSKFLLMLTGLFFATGTILQAGETLVLKGKDGPGKGKHIVLVSGDEEYRSEEALPQLAKILAVHHGFRCTVLFAIDPDTGYPAIAYFNTDVDDLRYAEWDGTTWNLTTIDSDGVVGQNPSLVFDPADGNPAT